MMTLPVSLRQKFRIVVSVLAVLFAGSVGAQDGVEFSDIVEGTATVTAVDQAQRLVTLRGPQGNEVTLEAGPEVRNFAQIEAGDVVRLTYEQYYSAVRIDPDQLPEAAAAASAGVALAEEGERPGAAIGAIESMVVMIESIGPNGRTATFITPDGALRAIVVRREEGRTFASSLAAGDLVQLTVAEALALVVEPVAE